MINCNIELINVTIFKQNKQRRLLLFKKKCRSNAKI